MKHKIISGIMLILLLIGMLTVAFNTQPVKASSEETVVNYIWSNIENATISWNDSDPVSRNSSYSGQGNWTFSPPDANGVVNFTIRNLSPYIILEYDPTANRTYCLVPLSDGYGKMYTRNNVGDVDIKSKTNVTGIFFWKYGAWHTPGEEWIGDGTPDPAGSIWWTRIFWNAFYQGNGTDGPLIGSYSYQLWFTTGFSENIVVEPASGLNGSYVNATGVLFLPPYVGSNGTYVYTYTKLNIPFASEHLDIQSKGEITVEPEYVWVEIPIKGGENATIESNVTITNALVTKNTLHFDVSGPAGATGWINVTFPIVNTTEIKVFIDGGPPLTPPPFPIITTNGTHYFIYFEFTLSTHNITIQFGSTQVGGISLPVNKLSLLATYIGLTMLVAVAVITVVYVKKRKRYKN